MQISLLQRVFSLYQSAALIRLLLNRLLQAIPVLWIVATLTFFMIRAAPGGPFNQERAVSPLIIERIHAHYGLDQPLTTQYFRFLGNLLQGDLGPSYRYEGRSVAGMIGESFPVSMELGIYSMLVALCIGIPVGVVAAARRNGPLDYVPMGMAMVGICLPAFVLGPVLALVFGVWLGIVNPSGWFLTSDRVLPALTVGLAFAAYIARLTRSAMIEVLSQDFIRTARAKGLHERRILWKHALRGGLLPVAAYLGPAFAGIITGSFVVETLFNIPGLGQHFVRAALNRDYTMVQGTVLLYAALVMLMNFAADVMQAWLNPRIRAR